MVKVQSVKSTLARPPTKIAYRADIDGLRGIAVIAVIAYHIDESLLPGGFIGVDIFFVISGFLITQLILTDLKFNQFSILEFYRRRINRIAPAMMLVVLVTLIAANALLLPEDVETTARSAVASVAGIANVYFWLGLDSGYFAPDVREVPLLHLWSLGVEEQFYLVWPMLLLAAHKRILCLPNWLLVIAGLLSFGAGSLLYGAAPGFVFYMLPTRAGELLIGAGLAIAVSQGKQLLLPAKYAILLAVAGAMLVVVSLFFITSRSAFPGLVALAPTCGTAALILAGSIKTNFVSSMVSSGPLRWAGLVSYSAYLWHWPLLAFQRYGSAELSTTNELTTIFMTFFLAYLSFQFVETPARRSTKRFGAVLKRRLLVPCGVITTIAVASIAASGYGLHLFSSDYVASLDTLRDRMRSAHTYDYICQHQRMSPDNLVDSRCVVGGAGVDPPKMLVIGDSNAAHYVGVIKPIAEAGSFRFRNALVQSCPPTAVDPRPFLYERDVDNCRKSLLLVREVLTKYDVVAMAASWPGYLTDQDDFLSGVFALATNLAAQGKLVILLGKAPVPENFDRRCNAKSLRFPLIDCSVVATPPAQDILAVNLQLAEFAGANDGVEYFDLTIYICPSGTCSTDSAQGRPLYFDPHHLLLDAAEELGMAIVESVGIPPPFDLVANWETDAE